MPQADAPVTILRPCPNAATSPKLFLNAHGSGDVSGDELQDRTVLRVGAEEHAEEERTVLRELRGELELGAEFAQCDKLVADWPEGSWS